MGVNRISTEIAVLQEPRNHQLTIRIPRRLRQALDEQAARESSSVADVLNNLLALRYPVKEPKALTRRQPR
jgi:hypothetical protein